MKIFLAVFFLSFSVWSQSLQVLDAKKAAQASYLSAELNEAIPYWIVDGEVYTQAQARDLILNENRKACVSWLMNFSDNKTVSKVEIQQSLLQNEKRISHWKTVNERPIYMDDETSFVLSFICAGKNSDGDFVEVESTDYIKMFQSIYLFEPHL